MPIYTPPYWLGDARPVPYVCHRRMLPQVVGEPHFSQAARSSMPRSVSLSTLAMLGSATPTIPQPARSTREQPTVLSSGHGTRMPSSCTARRIARAGRGFTLMVGCVSYGRMVSGCMAEHGGTGWQQCWVPCRQAVRDDDAQRA